MRGEDESSASEFSIFFLRVWRCRFDAAWPPYLFLLRERDTAQVVGVTRVDVGSVRQGPMAPVAPAM